MESRIEELRSGECVLLSAESLADMLQISVRTLWRMRSSGKLPLPIKVGGSVRWRADEIREWISAGCPPLKDQQQNRVA